jgi:hypothetical protein
LLDEVPLPDRDHDETRRQIARAVSGYLLPRLDRADAPLIVAVAGPGGAGKSFVVNRLAGGAHCPEGTVRPTTTSPTVIVAGGVEGGIWSSVERRIRGAAPSARVVHGDADEMPQTILVDLPAATGPALYRTLGLADLVLLVVTPERYADEPTWSLLRKLRAIGIPVWIVMNRTTGPDDEVLADLVNRVNRAGISAPIFGIAEGAADDLGGLRRRLDDLVGAARDRLLDEELRARMEAAFVAAAALREPMQALHSAGIALASAAGQEYERAVASVRDLVVGDDLLAWAETSSWPVVADRLASVVTRRIGEAAWNTASAWMQIPGGRELIEAEGPALWRHAPDTASHAQARLLRWEVEVAEIVDVYKRRKLSPAKLDDVVAVVIQRALGDTAKVRWRIRRRMRGGVDPAAEEARAHLATMAAAIVRDDEQRFLTRLGPRPSVGTIAELVQLTEQTDELRGDESGKDAPPASTADGDLPSDETTDA